MYCREGIVAPPARDKPSELGQLWSAPRTELEFGLARILSKVLNFGGIGYKVDELMYILNLNCYMKGHIIEKSNN